MYCSVVFFVALVSFYLTNYAEGGPTGCYVRPSSIPQHIISPLPHSYVSKDEIPLEFDWRNVGGTNFVTSIRNQMMPKFCGSCWAFGSTSAISDRMKIMTKGLKTDIILSVQALLDCGQYYGAGSCNGGSFEKAHEFMHKYGNTDETCAPYAAVDYSYNSELPCQETMCRQCDRFGNCHPVKNETKHYVSEYGMLPKENITAMMAEIYKRGPIACSMYAHSSDFEYYQGGIINNTNTYPYTTHVISLVGWGEENGVPFWIGRNSYGTIWGEEGFFRIIRGANSLLIESHCGWAVPKI